MSKETQKKREELLHRTWMSMLKILVIFGIPAAIGFFVGRWIDQTYDMRPYGTLAVLAATFLFSWVLVIRMYQNLMREFRKLDEQEQKEKEEKQQQIQKDLEESK